MPPELPPEIVSQMGGAPIATLRPAAVQVRNVSSEAVAGLYFFTNRRVLLVASRKPQPPVQCIWELSPRFITVTTGGVRIGDLDQFAIVGDAYSTVNTLRQLMGIPDTRSAAAVVPQVADQDRWRVATGATFCSGVRLSVQDQRVLVAQLADDTELRWSLSEAALAFHPASPGTPANVVVDQPVFVGTPLCQGSCRMT